MFQRDHIYFQRLQLLTIFSIVLAALLLPQLSVLFPLFLWQLPNSCQLRLIIVYSEWPTGIYDGLKTGCTQIYFGSSHSFIFSFPFILSYATLHYCLVSHSQIKSNHSCVEPIKVIVTVYTHTPSVKPLTLSPLESQAVDNASCYSFSVSRCNRTQLVVTFYSFYFCNFLLL